AAINYVEEHLKHDFSGIGHQQLEESWAERVHGRAVTRGDKEQTNIRYDLSSNTEAAPRETGET
ncbi:MAG: hypothetical protein RL215_1382, partial [Planctomycetota bacterium]